MAQIWAESCQRQPISKVITYLHLLSYVGSNNLVSEAVSLIYLSNRDVSHIASEVVGVEQFNLVFGINKTLK